MMNSSTSRSSSRSRFRSRSRGQRRRRSPRSRSHSGSGDEDCGGSGQHARRGSSRKDRSRKRRLSRSKDQDMPCRPHSNASVPVENTRHATEESSDSSEDDDKPEGTDKGRSRNKKIRKVDVSNPLSMFRKQTRQMKRFIMSSKFVKDEELGLRGIPDLRIRTSSTAITPMR